MSKLDRYATLVIALLAAVGMGYLLLVVVSLLLHSVLGWKTYPSLVLGTLIGGGATIGYWHRCFRTAKRYPPGHCRRCGYDLTGNVSGVCTECGRRIT